MSILVAAKDEERSIAQVIESHIAVMQASDHDIAWEIGVLDDGSTDKTFATVLSLQDKYPQLKVWHNDNPSGIANAFNQLANCAEHEWIYITSGDGQFTALGFKQMFESWLVNQKTTLGIRSTRFSSYGPWRSFISYIFQLTTRAIFRVNLHDPGSVRIIKKEVALLTTKSRSTMRDAELLARAHRTYGGLQFVEIPFLPREDGKASGVKTANLIDNLLDLFFLTIFSGFNRRTQHDAHKPISGSKK